MHVPALDDTFTPQPAPRPPSGALARWDWTYRVASGLAAPWFAYRRLVLGKDRLGRDQKRGYVPERAPHPRRVWLHAVSVGEAIAAEPLLKALEAAQPALDLVVTTTTPTGQEVARKRYGEARVCYFPWDYAACVRRALERIQPRLIVLMELEVWPNLTREAAYRGIPLLVANGRITARSAKQYRRVGGLLKPTFQRVQGWLMQDQTYAERVLGLGVDPSRVRIAGNLKYDAVATEPPAPEVRAQRRAALGLASDAPVFIGGSLHPGEETVLLRAWKKARESFPALRLILVPRHPENWDRTERAIQEAGETCARYAALTTDAAQHQASSVILVDAMGVLKDLYACADVAFVGGSLIPFGGQSPMEPAGQGVPVLYGPHTHNFAEPVEILHGCQGGREVHDEADLTAALLKWLRNPEDARAAGARGRAAFQARQGAAAATAACILRLLAQEVD
jgi:3-deoxy-D-manno-octulosonic-acid transferase